jgi:rare lipoprotein A
MTSRSSRPARALRNGMAIAAMLMFPLSGLSASTGAESSAAESFTATPAPTIAHDSVVHSDPEQRIIGGGSASYYAAKFHGRPTASGERFDNGALTAAHRTLPFGSMVRVINPANGKSVTVRINDRGPFAKGRVIDVSRAAAEELGLIARGHAPVELALIEG